MRDTVLLFESRDLCYESNQHFVVCLEEAFEQAGYPVEVCDLSWDMEEQLKAVLARQKNYLAAFDFNSLLPRLEFEDGTPFLELFCVPFFNYLVDHPLYHHTALVREFPCYSVICIDRCHQQYAKEYYPWLKGVFCLPLGGMRAGLERSFDQKRLELLFLGTYYPEEALWQELMEYPADRKAEVLALVERMEEDPELTQEEALAQYLWEKQETLGRGAFAERLNQDYLADKYLRNQKRRQAALAAAEAGVPFTVVGHGWEGVPGLERAHISLRPGVGFAASLQVMADAKMLLNSTPGFCGGLHDRVYSAMLNHTLCVTEGSRFAREKFGAGTEMVFYNSRRLDELTEQIRWLYENPDKVREIAERAWEKAVHGETWQKRVEELCRFAGLQGKAAFCK